MSKVLETFELSVDPALDVEDFDITFVAWLAMRSDTGSSIVQTYVKTEAGVVSTNLTVTQSSLAAGIAKVWLQPAGAVKNETYLVSAQILTAGGRKKTATIRIRCV